MSDKSNFIDVFNAETDRPVKELDEMPDFEDRQCKVKLSPQETPNAERCST